MVKKRIISYFIIFMLLLVWAMPLTAMSENVETAAKTVKVAYLISPGYQEGGEGEYKSGQGYEYLQKIASYTGWTYEYVYGDFSELLQKLEDGEVDIMGNLSYTEEMARHISYGDYEQGRESFYIYVKGTSSEIHADDFTTVNGKRIGVSAGSYQEKVWDEWCEEHNIVCDVIEYANIEDRQKALNSGEIDASLGSLMENRNEETEDWRSVFSFGSAPYYFGVNKNQPQLLKELNSAQGKILHADPYYNEYLNKRYTANSILSKMQLDNDEKEWLEQHKKPLKVGCMQGYLPISDLDENGEMHGVLPDVVSAIRDHYIEYDMDYEIITYSDYNQMISDLKNGIIDVASPIYGDYWNADQEGISITNAFMTTTMLLLQKGNIPADKIKKLGIDTQSTIQNVYARIYFPECELVMYSSMEGVTNALNKGEIDAALSTACSYHVLAILYPKLGEISRSTLPNNVDIAMAVSKDNPELMSLINRGLAAIGDNVVYNSLASNSNVDKKVTMKDYISSNPGTTIIIVCGIISFAVIIITALIIAVIRLKNANARASTDAMTGLLNKVSMRELTKDELKHGGALFMIDIDNFKTVNDVLGHEVGDRVIIHLAESLQKIFRSGDLIGRFGGDEFLVFLPGAEISEELISSKVMQMQNAFKACEVFSNHKEIEVCSVSVGALMLENGNNITYTEAFRKVDAALYEAKKKGKKTFTIAKSITPP